MKELQRSLVIIKPDASERGLAGEIISRFEKVGLKIVASKVANATDEQIDRHYEINNDAVCTRIGCKSVGVDTPEEAKEKGVELSQLIEMGREVLNWNRDYMKRAPLFILVFEGYGAIKRIRGLVGFTNPPKAAPGTIRSDFGVDSIPLANAQKRGAENMVHASGEPEEAENEINIWFPELSK